MCVRVCVLFGYSLSIHLKFIHLFFNGMVPVFTAVCEDADLSQSGFSIVSICSGFGEALSQAYVVLYSRNAILPVQPTARLLNYYIVAPVGPDCQIIHSLS